jgi:hypothetical protein
MADVKCKHIKDDGTPCGAFAMTGGEFCFFHNPDIDEAEKKQAQTKGGANRALTIKEGLPAIPVKAPSDAITLLNDTIDRVRGGTLDIRVANCIGVLTGHLLKAFEVADLTNKVEFIEQVIIEKRAGYKRRG